MLLFIMIIDDIIKSMDDYKEDYRDTLGFCRLEVVGGAECHFADGLTMCVTKAKNH